MANEQDNTQTTPSGQVAEGTSGAGDAAETLYGKQEVDKTEAEKPSNDADDVSQEAGNSLGLKSKDADDNASEEEDENADDAKKELFGKPEKYEYEMPEGYSLNEELTSEFNEIAGKYDMSQKGANELMALAVKLTQQTQTKIEDAYAQAHEARKSEYQKALVNDKEIGGAKLDENLKVANLAYVKFAPQEVQDILLETGLNAHPQIVKMFVSIGKQIQHDTIHDGNSPSGEQRSAADILYGNTTGKK